MPSTNPTFRVRTVADNGGVALLCIPCTYFVQAAFKKICVCVVHTACEYQLLVLLGRSPVFKSSLCLPYNLTCKPFEEFNHLAQGRQQTVQPVSFFSLVSQNYRTGHIQRSHLNRCLFAKKRYLLRQKICEHLGWRFVPTV